MSRVTVIVMGIVGLGMLLALVGLVASAAPIQSVSLELKGAPDWVYPMEEVTLNYWVNLTGHTYANVTHTAAYWDTASHAAQGYWDIAWYANVSSALTGTPGSEYAVQLTAPNITGRVYLILYAVVDGVGCYGSQEYGIDVEKKGHEAWIEILSAPGSGLTGHDVTVSWRIHNISKDRRTGSTLYWDMKSNAGTMAVGSYPHIVEGMTDGADDDCDGLVPLPDESCTVYFIITVSVHGLPDALTSPGEGAIICKSSPKLEKAMAVSPALVDSVVTANWTISYLDIDCSDITETSIVWSLLSHDSRAAAEDEILRIMKAYDKSSPKLQGAVGGNYATQITMPSEPCTVYYRAYAIVLGQPFMTEEQEIKVVSMQSFQVRESPTRVLSGDKVSVLAQLAFQSEVGSLYPEPGDALFPTSVELYFDNKSHADLSEYLALAPVPAAFTGTAGNFTANFTCTTEDHYFVLRCLVQGKWFWCAEEKRVDVADHYTFVVETTFELLIPNEEVTFAWRIDTGVTADVTATTLAWDTVAHAPSEGIAPYAHKVAGVPGANGRYTATFTAPASPGRVYILVQAIVLGKEMYSPTVQPVDVVAPPSIEQVAYKSTVEQGKDLKIRFTVLNATAANVTLLELRWDAQSHAGTTNASLYPNVVSITPEADGTYEVTIKAPKKKEVYFVVHAEVYDRDYLAQGEGKVSVKEPSPGVGGPLALGALAMAGAAMVLNRRRWK